MNPLTDITQAELAETNLTRTRELSQRGAATSASRDETEAAAQAAELEPLLAMGEEVLASGETADGVNRLIDRQHPHDFVMELSASYSKRLSDKDSVYGYIGLPGEPAFGPPAFQRQVRRELVAETRLRKRGRPAASRGSSSIK